MKLGRVRPNCRHQDSHCVLILWRGNDTASWNLWERQTMVDHHDTIVHVCAAAGSLCRSLQGADSRWAETKASSWHVDNGAGTQQPPLRWEALTMALILQRQSRKSLRWPKSQKGKKWLTEFPDHVTQRPPLTWAEWRHFSTNEKVVFFTSNKKAFISEGGACWEMYDMLHWLILVLHHLDIL